MHLGDVNCHASRGAFLRSALGVMVGHSVGEDGAWRAHSLRTEGLFRIWWAAGTYVSPHCQTHTKLWAGDSAEFTLHRAYASFGSWYLIQRLGVSNSHLQAGVMI